MDAKKLGLFICQIRKENHMMQKELAEKIHVTDKAISRWERGIGFADMQLLEPLSFALHITIAELMTCKRNTNYSNEEVSKLLNDLNNYRIECFKQDKQATRLALFCMIVAAFIVYISEHGNILGSLFVGSIFALSIVGIYCLYFSHSSKKSMLFCVIWVVVIYSIIKNHGHELSMNLLHIGVVYSYSILYYFKISRII